MFKIVDLFNGPGTFVLLSEALFLKGEKKLVSFGSTHVTFEDQNDKSIIVKFLTGPLQGEVF